MRTPGLIGGMSWESTQTYYRLLNKGINARLGGLHSANMLLHSVDFAEIDACQQNGDWDRAGGILADSAARLEKAGADFLLLCTNTMHKVAGQIQKAVRIPLLHIADATACELKKTGLNKVGLLGTRYTLLDDFYTGRLAESGIETLIPNPEEIDLVNAIIFKELCKGVIKPESKQLYLEVIKNLKQRGAAGIILGCTEIGMLIIGDDTDIPVFDTTLIHAQKAIDFCLAGQ